MSRIESTHEAWPFQPWPARRGGTHPGWDDQTGKTRSVFAGASARIWLLLALVPMVVVVRAGAAVADWPGDDTRGTASSDDSGSSAAPRDQHLAALLLEHRRAVRGL
jgi:hypothetical protein